ncbi:hypothetical protein QAD02_013207 [Eretmocerus hayati]|uniref:Uncharacterized protein n=1 Tax=Eretmocerus hayati TaxID=131215 RepID=A0ACC2P1Y7_9HYME|nr:hypothetical protein QAD02_013207 [Eretmocerus hayati]
MANPQDLTVLKLKEILRSKELLATGNRAELILRLEEANPDRSWIREFCQTNNPLLRDALEKSRRLNEEKQEMAQRIAELQRQLTEMAQNRQGINSEENEQIRIAEIGDGSGGVDGADAEIANGDALHGADKINDGGARGDIDAGLVADVAGNIEPVRGEVREIDGRVFRVGTRAASVPVAPDSAHRQRAVSSL